MTRGREVIGLPAAPGQQAAPAGTPGNEAGQGTGPDRDPDVLTAARTAGWPGFRNPRTEREPAAAGELPGIRAGRERRFSRSALYERIAGPRVPFGEILTAAELGRRISLPSRAVRRAAAGPGTPGKLPGLQAGKQPLFACEAVTAAIRGLSKPPASGAGGAGRDS